MHRYLALVLLISYAIKENNGQKNATVSVSSINTNAFVRHCEWLTCNVTGFPSPFLSYSLECCSLPVPLNYDQPNRSISISMTRLSPLQPTTENNTLFVLMGGPGISGWAILESIARLIPAKFGITLVLPDHRGIGLSTILGCDDNNSQILTAQCIDYLTSRWGVDGLNQFSITAAAHDLAVQVQSYQMSHPGRIVIYGVSYGTVWLDRFLQIYPTLVQSAIMDGVAHPFQLSISRYDLWASSVASQFLTYCQVQPDCGQYFPPDQPPSIMLLRILTELDSNNQQCIKNHFRKYQLTSNQFRTFLFYLMQAGEQYMYRTIIPAVIFRLHRCSKEDVTVLEFFFRNTLGPADRSRESGNGPAFIYSSVLNANIVHSELWLALNESEVDRKTINNWFKSTIMAPDNGEQLIVLRYQWPKYPLDQYRYQLASYAPLLMISGQLDPATVFQQAAQLASITSSTRTFYSIPLGGHGTITLGLAGYDCPLHLICSWAFPSLFPAQWSDPICIRRMPTTIDFVGSTEAGRQVSMQFFNVSRPFGNDSAEPIPSASHHLIPIDQYSHILCVLIFLLFDAIFA